MSLFIKLKQVKTDAGTREALSRYIADTTGSCPFDAYGIEPWLPDESCEQCNKDWDEKDNVWECWEEFFRKYDFSPEYKKKVRGA